MHVDLKESVCALLEIIKQQVSSISDEEIWELHEPLSQAVIFLERTWNARRPLVGLPEETLHQILSHIPEPADRGNFPRFNPHWKSECRNTLMLVPVTQTCHRLREVAVGNPLLWRHGCTKPRQTTLPFVCSRSQTVPLTVVLSDPALLNIVQRFRDTCPPEYFQHVRDLCQPVHLQRIRELHLCTGEDSDSPRLFYGHFDSLWPALEYLTLHTTINHSTSLELVPEHMPRLRYLDLWVIPSQLSKSGFPTLTHLSVSASISQSDRGQELVDFIFACPSLESLILSLFNMSPAVHGPPRVVFPIPQTVLPRLRRVILRDMTLIMLRFYLSAFELHIRNDIISVQVLGLRDYDISPEFPWDAVLPYNSYCRKDKSLLVMLQHTPSDDRQHGSVLSLTATGPKTTVRVADSSYYPNDLRLHQASFLAGVRDVWIDFPQLELKHTAIISTMLMAVPTLETVTLVTDHTRYRGSTGPCLHAIPKYSERAGGSSRIRILRFVHGFSIYEPQTPPRQESHQWDPLEMPMKLDLSSLLAGFASGEYDYFDELVLQTTADLEVDADAVARLREYVPVVRVERIEGLPEPPVPKFFEDAASSTRNIHVASLW
ncbi:hypothetical protein C8Q80DRAFT_114002 [Daedaleopsis nitida]|nr:hypothetical protein C8Q80DRAFT_114002 [Daedaleopsis nitida]